VSVDIVVTRDRSSGRYHKRYYDPETGKFSSFEGDNLDSAGLADTVLWSEVETAEPGDLCRNCFPEPKQDGQTG
jgi:hypothetical protein